MRRAVRAIGQCAIKLESAADQCVHTMMDLIATRIAYVVQEAVVVLKVGNPKLRLFRSLTPIAFRTSFGAIRGGMKALYLLYVIAWATWTRQKRGHPLSGSLENMLTRYQMPNKSSRPFSVPFQRKHLPYVLILHDAAVSKFGTGPNSNINSGRQVIFKEAAVICRPNPRFIHQSHKAM